MTATDFETAADAVVSGDIAPLRALLQEHPDLVRARSAREHHSTLLHYVSANGVEDQRQKTPKNIVEIAELLLSAGADVNAESEAYGGGSTTLGLTATSCHPENAGVQLNLLQLLIDRGAAIDANIVNSCLRNGRGAAAQFLAARGAPLDLEGAAGTGRLNRVQELMPASADSQRMDGFAWACEFGHFAVVEYMLRQRPQLARERRTNGQLGLHWAAYGGYQGIVTLLLEHGAPLDAKEDTYGGTPLDWALYGRHHAAKR